MIPVTYKIKCEIVIPIYDQVDYTRHCIDSIFANTECPFRLILVNDGSREQATRDYLNDLQSREPERVRVLHNEKNIGYVRTVNHGLANTTAEFVVVMNNDTLVYPDWLTEMIAIAEKDPATGLVNPLWELPKLFKKIGRDRYFQAEVQPHKGTWIETDWIRGCCYLTKRSVIDKIGGLDLDFAPAYYDDWDYSMRALAAGFKCVRALGAYVFHFKNITYSSYGSKDQVSGLLSEKGTLFFGRWGRPLKILLVDNGTIEDFGERLPGTLRDQHKIVLITSRADMVTSAHTNLAVLNTPAWLIGLRAFFLLLDNARHSPAKRFHLILADKGFIAFIKRCRLFFGKCYWETAGLDAAPAFAAIIERMRFRSQNTITKAPPQ